VESSAGWVVLQKITTISLLKIPGILFFFMGCGARPRA
jgi:hypothetical protein